MKFNFFYIAIFTGIVGFIFHSNAVNATGSTEMGYSCSLQEATPEILDLTCGDVYLDSGGLAGAYSNSEQDTVLICPASAGDAVILTFTFVDIESSTTNNGNQDGCWDFMSIYNGDNTNAPVLAATLCGENDGDGDQPTVSSSLLQAGDQFSSTDPSGCLTVVFSSDGTISEAGWAADVTCAPLPSCLKPTDLAVANIAANSADFSWTDINGASLWDIELVNSDLGETPMGTPTNSGVSKPFTQTGLTGNNDYEYYVRADCGGGDLSEWEGPIAFTTNCDIQIAPYIENFDNAGLIPDCWETSGAELWLFADGSVTQPAHGGNLGDIVDHTSGTGFFAWVDDSSPESTGTTLISPSVDVSSLTNPGLTFWINSDNEGNSNVDFSVDLYDGTNWNLAVYTSNTNTDGWLKVYIPLSSFTITGSVQARFIVDENNGTDFYDDFALDDVAFEDLPSCFPPSMPTASNIGGNSADISWMAGGTETLWDYELVDLSAGGVQTMVPTLSGVSTPLALSGLTELNDYAFYVRSDCGGGDFSTWVGPLNFTSTYNTPPACDGFFLDNGGLSTYAAGSQDTVSICPDNAGDVVTLTFTFVDLEVNSTGVGQQDGCWDFLTIYSGNSTAAPVLAATLCGELDGDGGTPSVASSLLQAGDSFTSLDASGCLTVVFDSDGFGQEEGFIAEVSCMPAPSCPQPNNQEATNVTSNSADLNWMENGSATLWDIELVDITQGNTPIGSPTSSSVSKPFTQTGLLANTSYEYYVRSNCGGGEYSEWSGPFAFLTACAPVLGDSLQNPVIVGSLPYSATGNNATCYTDQYSGSTGIDVYYQFTTGNCTGIITLSTCSANTDFDTRVYLLDENGVQIATNDDAATGTCSFLLNGNNRFSILETPVQANTTYFAVVEGFSLSDAGNFELEITGATSLTTMAGTITNVSCNGSSDGAITPVVSGGTPPYTFQWNNGASTPSVNGLAAGTYSAFITDNNGCGTVLTGLTITEPDPVFATIDMISNVRCNGNSDGIIQISPLGGTPPYSFLWSDGAITEDNIGIPIGLYSLTITDGNNCTGVIPNITINEPPVLGLTFQLALNANCNGNSDGSISIATSGGTLPYSYEWSNGAVTEDLTGIPAGTYTVTVTDLNLCEATLPPVTINEPTAIEISLDQASALVCNGDTDGAVSVSITGGQAPYTYAWSNGDTNEDISGLAAGDYILSVTDNTGCLVSSMPYTISEPTALGVAGTTISDVSCNGESDGSIAITASGGTTGYTYAWSNGKVTPTVTGLFPGDYTVEITDANGCIYNSPPYIIGEPTLVGMATSSVSNVSCNSESDGAVSVVASGGISPYTYVWSDGQTTSTASNLVASDYSLTITDSNGCDYESMSILVTEPDFLLANTDNIINVSCNGGSDGAISVTTSGGTAPYTYAWSNGATTEDISGLIAGNYQLSLTDDNGCAELYPFFLVAEPDSLSINLDDAIGVSCNGGSDGSIAITSLGGTAPYTYEWSNGVTSEDISGLAPANYSLTITDNNNCSYISGLITVTEPSTLEIILPLVSNASCNGESNGSISVTGTGGTAPYTYTWSNGASTAQATGLGAGNYSLTLSDDNGCSTTASYEVMEPTQIGLIDLSTTPISCFGNSDGSVAVIAVSGGINPYVYSLNGTSFQIGNVFGGLGAGSYGLTIMDAEGCIAGPTPFTIEGPAAALSLSTTVTKVSANGAMDGSISAMVSGGEAPYSYIWSNGETGSSVSGLAPGTFCVTVSDAFGCGVATCDDVTVISGTEEIETLATASLFPNPTGNFAQLDLTFTQATDLEFQLVNTLGQVLLQERHSDVIKGTYNFDMAKYASGIYFIRIRVGEQVMTKRLLKLD